MSLCYPVGTLFHPQMLSPKTRRRFYEENDDSDEMESHFPHNNGPFGNAPPAADDDDCPYFGKYGKYTTVYDSDGYEIEDYINPFHPDYPHFWGLVWNPTWSLSTFFLCFQVQTLRL